MTDSKHLLIYGANGYSGHLAARMAGDAGLTPVLAGRNPDKVRPVAESLGLSYRAFSLDVPSTVDDNLADVGVVLHCAGPFSRTAEPMADSCLRTGTHYLDITGELDVFEALTAKDAVARERGVMLMPGTGFDVVPSDCLANHVAGRVPEATHLTIAFRGVGARMSHGTATTTVENLHRGAAVRKDGALRWIRSGWKTRKVDYGRGPTLSMAIPWGDLSTAFTSTGIPNIEVYTAVPRKLLWGARVAGFMGPILKTGPVQRYLKKRVDAGPAGPDDDALDAGLSLLWAEARDGRGRVARARLETPSGYKLTALASLAIAKRALAGNAPAGFQTPAMAYGADFILEIPDTRRQDID